jgi:hypothetical protein
MSNSMNLWLKIYFIDFDKAFDIANDDTNIDYLDVVTQSSSGPVQRMNPLQMIMLSS